QRNVGQIQIAPLVGRRLIREGRRDQRRDQDVGGRIALFGRNALQTASCVSMYGPPIKSMQYGTAGKTPSSVSLIAFGCPGRLRISALPRITPVCRDRIAVATYLRLTARICSPKPGSALC